MTPWAPYELACQDATPHGVVAAVWIPDRPEPAPPEVLERLHPAEAAFAATLRGYRQGQFAGGRLAARSAANLLGGTLGPVLPDARGAPQRPPGLLLSISHKGSLAIAMASRVDAAVDTPITLGADLEDYGPPRPGIAPRVLRPEELAEVEGLPEARRWIAILLRFSIKESVYKALDPYVQRYVGFHEASVSLDLDGAAHVTLHLEHGEGPFHTEARYDWFHGRILTSARIWPARR